MNYNARTLICPAQVGLLVASLREFGFTNPVLIDDHDRVIAGHGRLAAAKAAGLAEVPCVVLAHLSDTQRRAYILADNQLAERAGWDRELLAFELGALRDDAFDLALMGFERSELERLIGAGGLPGLTDDDDAPACPEAPVSVPGDVWLCGPHRVMCGDALDAGHMVRLMMNGTAALVLTDPPYNVNYAGKGQPRLKIVNDAMSSDAFYRFLLASLPENLYAVCEPGAPAYVFHSDRESLNFQRALLAAGFRFAQCCQWVKPSFVLGRHDYHVRHESVLYSWKPGAPHRWYGDRKQSTVWAFDRPLRSDLHPTMKPVALLAYLLMNSSQAGDTVVDPFGGSGSTLIACGQTGRAARLMEIDPRYCDVIVKRWQDWSGQAVLREADAASFGMLPAARPVTA